MSPGEKVVLGCLALAAPRDVADDGKSHQEAHEYPVVKRVQRKIVRGIRQVVLLMARSGAGLRLAAARGTLFEQLFDGLRDTAENLLGRARLVEGNFRLVS